MNNLVPINQNQSTFNFCGHPIRVEMIDGKPYFCGIDICNAISIKNNRDAIARLKDGVVITDVIDNLGRKQGLSYVNEANLYKIALQSRKPEAEPFVNWVCEEVLPTLRKTGTYSIAPQVDMKALGGLVKRCCRASIKEYWVDFISGKPETMQAIQQTLGFMLTNILTSYQGEDKYFNVGDKEILEYLQRWYWTRHNKILKALEEKEQKLEEIETRIRIASKALNQ